MLVIRRRAGESLWIGDSVEVEIIEAGPGKVKLGIRAPREIPVVRSEIRATREQNQRAAGGVEAGVLKRILAGVRRD
jgi:carbon storage regulator